MARTSSTHSAAPLGKLGLFLSLSGLLHLGLATSVMSLGQLPATGFELRTPQQPLEFSVTSEASSGPAGGLPQKAVPETLENETAPASPPPSPATTPPAVEAIADAPQAADAGVPEDAGTSQRTDSKPERTGDARTKRAEAAAPPASTTKAKRSPKTGTAGLPVAALGEQGALISLRVDNTALRSSSHRPLLSALVARLPDARAVLAGTDVDPVEDLDALWIAAPGPSRQRAVVAGQLRHDEAQALTAAQRLAAKQGKPLAIDQHGQVRMMPWLSPEGPDRVLALLPAKNFVIARPTDLPRVLALRSSGGGRTTDGQVFAFARPPDDALARLDVFGLRHFMRPQAGVPLPERVEVTLASEDSRGGFHLAARATLPSARDARELHDHLSRLQRLYAKHPLVQLSGFAAALGRVKFDVKRTQVRVTFELQATEVGNLLRILRDSLPAGDSDGSASPGQEVVDAGTPSP